MTLQIRANAVIAKLYGADRTLRLAVSELLSYEVEAAQHSALFKMGKWDGRSTFYDFKSDTFPAGFLGKVYSYLVRQGKKVHLVRKRPPEPLGAAGWENIDGRDGDPRYDYQADTVRRLLRQGRMIAQCATGAGKSRIALLTVACIRRPTLFLTTRGVLMYQMKDTFEEHGYRCGVLGDGEWRPTKGINVGMVQTLAANVEEWDFDTMLTKAVEANMKKKAPLDDKTLARQIGEKFKRHQLVREQTIKLLSLFELVIGEEAHEAGGNSYFEILRHCKNAHYRLALTATPFMRDDAEANMRLMAAFGPIGIKITEKMLIDRGVLARPYFKFIVTPKPKGLSFSRQGWPDCYNTGVVEHPERNRLIIAEMVRAKSFGLTTMCLVTRKDHGRLLAEMAEAAGLRVKFIFGEHDQSERKAALKGLGAGVYDVLIGSSILDVGVDVPAVGMVILAGGGKAEVAQRQRIGRGLRAKKFGPNVCFIVDFLDSRNKHLAKHSAQRRAIVEQTPGFAEGILAANDDFDFSGLGFERKVA